MRSPKKKKKLSCAMHGVVTSKFQKQASIDWNMFLG